MRRRDFHKGCEWRNQSNLEYNLRHGVRHLTGQVQRVGPDGAWDLDELWRMKDNWIPSTDLGSPPEALIRGVTLYAAVLGQASGCAGQPPIVETRRIQIGIVVAGTPVITNCRPSGESAGE